MGDHRSLCQLLEDQRSELLRNEQRPPPTVSVAPDSPRDNDLALADLRLPDAPEPHVGGQLAEYAGAPFNAMPRQALVHALDRY